MTRASDSPAVVAGTNVDVVQLHVPHPRIRAKDWRAPLIHRLLKSDRYKDGAARLSRSFRGPTSQTDGTLGLVWKDMREDVLQCARTYQEPVLTEFATLGLACILLTENTDLSISEVTRRGEKVDYWIGDSNNRKKYVLEVGGQQGGSLDALASTKTAQLEENPWGSAGYICVAVYDLDAARLWYCEGVER